MPLSLLDRCGTADSIASFRAAADRRFADGLLAFESDDRERRAAAVYLWGYAVEMTVKAAVFRARGNADAQPLVLKRRAVEQLAVQAGLTWQAADLHAVDAWAALLVAGRAVWPTTTPFPPLTAVEVGRRASQVSRVWHPRMRYHANVAYRHEAVRMRDHARWFVERFDSL